MADDAPRRKKIQEVDKDIDAFLDSVMLDDIDAAVDARLDAEIADEASGPILPPRAQLTGAKDSVKYCRFVLRGEKCPFGAKCHYKHFAANPSGAAQAQEADLERVALTCALCQQILRSPVTLACGHTFDRECLQKISRQPRCPIDQQAFTTPLPEVDFTLRAYIDSRLPASKPVVVMPTSGQINAPNAAEEIHVQFEAAQDLTIGRDLAATADQGAPEARGSISGPESLRLAFMLAIAIFVVVVAMSWSSTAQA